MVETAGNGTKARPTLWRNATIATLAGGAPWGLIARGALVTEGDRIAWVGDEASIPAGLDAPVERDLGGALVTPGLVDCHTHLVYGGQRAAEFEFRLQGTSYEQIARAGGGPPFFGGDLFLQTITTTGDNHSWRHPRPESSH